MDSVLSERKRLFFCGLSWELLSGDSESGTQNRCSPNRRAFDSYSTCRCGLLTRCCGTIVVVATDSQVEADNASNRVASRRTHRFLFAVIFIVLFIVVMVVVVVDVAVMVAVLLVVQKTNPVRFCCPNALLFFDFVSSRHPRASMGERGGFSRWDFQWQKDEMNRVVVRESRRPEKCEKKVRKKRTCAFFKESTIAGVFCNFAVSPKP